MTEKIEALAGLLLEQTRERLARDYTQAQADAQVVRVTPGRKYTRIDSGAGENGLCGRLMVDHQTGEVFGILGYGKVDKRSRYGTLDTTGSYYWGDL